MVTIGLGFSFVYCPNRLPLPPDKIIACIKKPAFWAGSLTMMFILRHNTSAKAGKSKKEIIFGVKHKCMVPLVRLFVKQSL